MTEATEFEETETKVLPVQKKKIPYWVYALLAVALAVGAAFFWVKVIEPANALREAQSKLEETISLGKINAVNSDFVAFTPNAKDAGELPPGVNPKQLALAEGSKTTEPAHFIFSSENANSESHTLEIYMDFYSQRSRDFITLNKKILESQIASGNVVLKVYPILQKDSFSIYAPEALAEMFGTAPDKSWDFFTDVLKESITLTGEENADTVAELVAKVAQENGGKEVDTASVFNATFLTWLYTAANDPRADVGYIPPVIYVDGEELDQETITINDPEVMFNYFKNLKPIKN